MIYYFIAWYLIGFLGGSFIVYKYFGEYLIGDLISQMFLAISGPINIIVMSFILRDGDSIWDKRIF